MSTKILKQYINEVLKITVQKFDPSNQATKTYTRDYHINDDDADELDWFLDNYGKPAINLKTKKDKDKNVVKYYDQQSETQILSLIDRLENVAKNVGKTLDTNLLRRVMIPWGNEGYKALGYLATHTERTKEPFPFFSMTKNANVNNQISFSNIKISTQVFDHLMKVTPRIGKNDTGKGEFLIALLTGGIAGETGLYGDLEIGKDNWEVKVPSGNNIVRLGDVSSSAFVEKFQELFKTNQVQKLATEDQSLLNPESALKKISTTSGYKEILENPTIYGPLIDTINESLKHTLDEMNIAGFALVLSDKVKFVSSSSNSWSFENSGGKSRRIHIKYTPAAPTASAAKSNDENPRPETTQSQPKKASNLPKSRSKSPTNDVGT